MQEMQAEQRTRTWSPIAALRSPAAPRWTALASLVANVALVVTGGAVRLTGSGLGCPTWPRCTDDSYVSTSAMGVHGAIEFGNRALGLVLVVVAVLGFAAAMLQRPRVRRLVVLALLVALSIPVQAVLGGITVLTNLNPWVVASHFLVSIAIITAAYAYWVEARSVSPTAVAPEGSSPARSGLATITTSLTGLVAAAALAVLAVGTVVTGSGPHAGDKQARRTGLDPGAVAQAHADLVFLVVGLSLALWLTLRALGPAPAARRAGWLLVIILAQGAIGFVQYFTHVPALLVGAHMAGACAVWLATLSVFREVRRTSAGPALADRAVAGGALPDGHLKVMAGADWAPLLDAKNTVGA